MTGPGQPYGQPGWDLPSCARHPDRPTGLSCVRCGRPACPECLRDASVGYQCVDCVDAGKRTVRTARTAAGARISTPGTQPVVIPVLIALNVIVFAITAVQARSIGSNSSARLFLDWGLWPPVVASGELWRLVTSGFLHYGPVHLAFNMLALWIIGQDLEIFLGRLRIAVIYLVSLLGGSALVFLFEDTGAVTAGASGAVYGLMGGLAVMLIKLRRSPGPAMTLIGVNVVISFVVPNISILGHLGGLLFGTAATAVMVFAPRERRNSLQIAGICALMVAVLALVAAGQQRYDDVGDCSVEKDRISCTGST